MVGTTGQEQIGITILPFQLEIDFLWVVVPLGCVGNVFTLGWREERNACHMIATAADFGAQNAVVNFRTQLGMTPLAYPLRGNLQSGDLGTRREVLLLEDISDTGVETLVNVNGIALGRPAI